MSDHANCRLCGRPANQPVLTLVGMPRWNHRLLRATELDADAPVNLVIHRCDACGFVSLPAALDDDYYGDDYVNAPSSSPQKQAFLAEQAREFVDRFALRGRSILEVGCGDGGFLAALRDAGARCFGIEPSRAQRELALARQLPVEAGVLTAQRRIGAGPFDAFATRQVLEHVVSVQDFLAGIRAHLKPGGVGLVEVPNLDILLAQDRFFDFIPEHVNYFSARTLRLALELGGFDVLSVDPVEEGESLRALVRSSTPQSLEGVATRVHQLRTDVQSFIERHHARGERVAIWGAGGKGLAMLAVIDLVHVDLLVDGDPHKHGRYTPVSHLQVSPPSALAEQSVGAVVIMAPAYRREILRALREQFGFNGSVGVVGQTFEVIEAAGAGARGGNP